MPNPLDHATVIQQINFAEWAHHDLQVHPERTMLKARDINASTRADSRRRANATSASRRTAIRLHGENYRIAGYSTGETLDLKG